MEKANDPAREGEADNCLLAGDNFGHSTFSRARKPLLSVRLSEETLSQNLWRQVNEWDIARRVNGVVPGQRRLRPEDVPQEFGLALARLAERGKL